MKSPTYFSNNPITPNYEFEEGETIEQKVKRVVETKEPIDDTAPLIFTPKENGVIAAYNIRTDRWEIAQNAMDAKYKAEIAKARNRVEEPEIGATSETSNNAEGKSTTQESA